MVPVSDMLALVLRAFAHRSVARWHRRPEPVGEICTRCAHRAMHSRSRRHSHRRVAWHHSFFGWSDVMIEGVLRPLRRDGLPLSYTPQPWIERGRSGSIVIPGGTEIILVEGVGAARRELSNWFDATIWVQTDPDVAMARTIALDRDPPGFIDDWMRAENAHLAADQPWTRASAVVSGENPVSSDAVRVCLRASDATEPPGRARL